MCEIFNHLGKIMTISSFFVFMTARSYKQSIIRIVATFAFDFGTFVALYDN